VRRLHCFSAFGVVLVILIVLFLIGTHLIPRAARRHKFHPRSSSAVENDSNASIAIATVVGTFVTTWMTGRIARMNSAAVFISLLFWGWLWGVRGMLLSIPIIVIVKVVSQHVEQLHPLAELLGD
jgi:hypothetical protein